MPIIDWTVDAGLHRAYIVGDDRTLYRNTTPPVEVAQERREDFDLLNVVVVDTYGHNGYIKCFELIFAERNVQIEVGIGDGRNWDGFNLSDQNNADFLANVFMAVLKRPSERISARHAGRNWEARVALERRTTVAPYAVAGDNTFYYNGYAPPSVNVMGDDTVWTRGVVYAEGGDFVPPPIRVPLRASTDVSVTVRGDEAEFGTWTLADGT